MAMIRRQIQLTEELDEFLTRAAEDEGVSSAEYIRRLLDRRRRTSEKATLRAAAVASIKDFKSGSGKTDISVRHDDYLAEDLKDW